MLGMVLFRLRFVRNCNVISVLMFGVNVDVIVVMLNVEIVISSVCLCLMWLVNGLKVSVLIISFVRLVLNMVFNMLGVMC